ncbi:MAG: hypothetical protein KKA65_02200 [Nanoarchaeota archaeon]|nr:hypothetical protein [Nanoarchaeota archaeon]MBU4351486.1 hypothetical protein [Nanoarchaeota archaeon]MBU4456288.1 hypothetical protein [Nanoarchaeota archaeon]MCG2720138.1 hypothetical protein [Nanoarchaeota archaeon]
MTSQNIYEIMAKVFSEIEKEPTKLTNLPFEYVGMEDERAFTVENLETIACNHVFDDNPIFFGITELEGWTIRSYFTTGAVTYDYVQDLRREFPDFFKCPESQEYINSVNKRRKKLGLDSIS